jgi:predicted acyl esterase
MRIRTILYMMTLCIMLYANLSISQDNKYIGNKNHTRIKDTYQFPKLPMIQSPKMALTSVIKQDFMITLRDNVQMDCSRFFPNEPNPFLPNGYPTVIMVHGYGDRKETLEGFASAQSTYGYVVYTYSVRGQGNSGGLSNLISTTEAQDLVELVNFIRTDYQTGLDTSKILIMGGSQGGTVPYIAACSGNLKVKTIISALTSPEFASSWIENGSIKMTFLWTIDYTPDTARYSPQVLAMRNWVYSSAPDKWDSLAYWLPKDRNFTNIVSKNTIPVMMENAWQDKFFNAKGNISNIPYVTAPKRYYFGAVRGHGGDYSVTEDAWHENFFNEWYYYWIWGINNEILTRPKFHYAFSTYPEINGMWTFVHDSSEVWPPGTDNMILYFRNNNRLLTSPGTGQTSNLVNSVAAGFTMQTAVNEEFKGTAFNNGFKKASLTYNSAVLTEDVEMVGTPQIRLDYSSNTTECQFNFQIYEVSGTKVKLITRINYTDRKNTANSRKNVIFDGISHGHIFRAGDIIRIVLTNLDTAPDDSTFLGSNPHVLPDLKNGTSKIFYTGNSFINLPIRSAGSRPISLNSKNKIQQDVNSVVNKNGQIPLEYNLNQNYPNPFNPVTTINYSIPKNSFVTLKVYDISGKEITTLVKGEITPGFYSIKFNTMDYGLSSGVYFYKLEAGSYVNVKKLVLIK